MRQKLKFISKLPTVGRVSSLAVAIFLLWSLAYNRTTIESWKIPIHYEGDGIFVAAITKAYADGDMALFGPKRIERLNAPYYSILDDWPITEDILFYAMGKLARWTGVFAAVNIAFLIASLLAGITFYISARILKYNWIFAWTISLSYAFAPLLFYRSVGHITLAYYWVIPLGIICIYKCMHLKHRNMSVPLCLVIISTGIAIGIQNAYYAWMLFQISALSIVFSFINREYKSCKYLIVFCSLIGIGFLLMNMDSIICRLVNGANAGAVERRLVELDIHGLRIPSLFIPSINHRISMLANWSKSHYYGLMTVGEYSAPYLGIVGICGFLIVLAQGIRALIRKKCAMAGMTFLELLWVFAYSCSGGINLLLGVFGLILFRAGNRYSIFVLTISLLGLCKFLSRRCPKVLQMPCVALIAIIVFIDQIPDQVSKNTLIDMKARVSADKELVEKIETRLKVGEMVFQLPFCTAPETPPFANMLPYEHYTPYVHSYTTRWSYGAIKGRGIEMWQRDVENMKPIDMVRNLQQYGFSAIYISRRGYSDRGESLIKSLHDAGFYDSIEVDRSDVVIFFINAISSPTLPPLSFYLESSFWGMESNENHIWSWAREDAAITVFNPTCADRNEKFRFGLVGMESGMVSITAGGKTKQYSVDSSAPKPIEMKLLMKPGRNEIIFHSNISDKNPNTFDSRKISFGLFDPELIE
jgi:phosphoglycerol transferase